MRLHLVLPALLLSLTTPLVTASSSAAPAASTTPSASSAAASSAAPAASGTAKPIIVTDKTVTFTMPLIADPSGKIPPGTMPKIPAAGTSGTDKGTQIFNGNGGATASSNSPEKTNAAVQLNRVGAVGGVGALLLPLLL